MNQKWKINKMASCGCIFNPSLSCTDRDSDPLKVSKLISREDLQSEFYNISDFNLAKTNPESKLFIYPEDTLCVLKDLDLNRDIPNNFSSH